MESSDVYINSDIAVLICKRLLDQRLFGTLSSVAQVSKIWNAAAIPELYREFVLDLRSKNIYWSTRVLHTLRSNRAACHAVQELQVKRGVSDPYFEVAESIAPKVLVELISTILPLCRNLKSFQWNIYNPIPKEVIHSLNMHPRIKYLRVFVPSFGLRKEFECIKSLEANHKVTDLQIHIGWEITSTNPFPEGSDSRTRLNRAAKVNELLVKLPNLNTLDLGFSGDARSFPTLAFAFKTFPSVSKLTLRDWPFDHDGPMSIQHQLNFATLKHLKLLYGVAIDKLFISLLSHKTQLDSLCIEYPGLYTDTAGLHVLHQFLVSQGSLKELELFRPRVPLSAVIDCTRLNQKTITRLLLDLDGKSPSPTWSLRSTRTLRSPADMEAIRDNCPNLVEFMIFLPVEDLDISTSPYLPILKTFLKLANLEIYSNYKEGSQGQTHFFHDNTTVRKLAEAVWAPSLEHFEFEIDDPTSNLDYLDINCAGRRWAISYDNSITSPGFRVIDRTERKYEKWMKRLANAQGNKYVPSNTRTREEKYKAFVEAVKWFENNHGDESIWEERIVGRGLREVDSNAIHRYSTP